jgi:hypothetical protein
MTEAEMLVFLAITIQIVVVVWDGTKDVGINETRNGLNLLQDFVRDSCHTNVILIHVPHRHDLHVNPCVNREVEVFNRKLRKQMKIFENVTPIKVDPDRDLFTKHGLHMNNKGKEQAAKKTVSTINYILDKKIKIQSV